MARSVRYLDLEIESLAAGGKGVSRYEGKVVFVRGGFPGDRVKARVVRRRRDWEEAVVDDLLHASPLRIDPPCPNADICGGCQWMPVSYESQLRAKETIVRDCIERIGGIPDPPIEPILACDQPLGYRNKMEFTFSPRIFRRPEERMDTSEEEDVLALGLHAPGSFFRVVPLERCLLQNEISNRVLSAFQDAAASAGKPAYDTRTGRGFWRFCIIRSVKSGGETMLYYITSQPSRATDRAIVRAVTSQCPELSTVVAGVSASAAGVAVSESLRVLHGDGTIEEELGGFRFRISPESFFQTNSTQAGRMLDSIVELAGPGDGKLACDLYAGGGAISFFLAGRGYRVLGFESSPAAVSDGQHNAHLNDIERVALRIVDLADTPGWASAESIDLITADPPRAGIHPKAMKGIVMLSPPRIIMVSCNPATLARDLANLSEAGYTLKTVRPIDMFPQTHHVETVALLEKIQHNRGDVGAPLEPLGVEDA